MGQQLLWREMLVVPARQYPDGVAHDAVTDVLDKGD